MPFWCICVFAFYLGSRWCSSAAVPSVVPSVVRGAVRSATTPNTVPSVLIKALSTAPSVPDARSPIVSCDSQPFPERRPGDAFRFCSSNFPGLLTIRSRFPDKKKCFLHQGTLFMYPMAGWIPSGNPVVTQLDRPPHTRIGHNKLRSSWLLEE